MTEPGELARGGARTLLWTLLVLAPLAAGLAFLGSEPVHEAVTAALGVGPGRDVEARYEYSSRQIVLAVRIALLLLATFVVLWRLGARVAHVARPSLYAAATVLLLALVALPLLAYGWLTDAVAIELTRSGGLELVSRRGRESLPLAALASVSGSTASGRPGSHVASAFTRHHFELAFDDGSGKPLRRRMQVRGRWDAALTGLVSHLETMRPGLDTTGFWSWRPPGPAHGTSRLAALDFVGVCSGAGQAAAAPYRKDSGRRPLLAFCRRSGDADYFQLTGLPDGWVPDWDRAAETELVACVTPIERSRAKDCSFAGGRVLELHDTRFEVALHEAQTGRVLARTSLEAKAGACPDARMFERERESEDADPLPALVAFVAPSARPVH